MIAVPESQKTPLRIGVAGCMGRVGKLLVKELASGAYPDLTLAGGTIKSGSEKAGEDLGTLANLPPLKIYAHDDITVLCEASDVIIDFTTPEATVSLVKKARMVERPLVVGTTGLSPENEAVLQEAAEDIPLVYAANMSIGVTLLATLVEKAAAALDDEAFDIEISETHHKYKIDAPSGTALLLGRAAAEGKDTDLDRAALYARHGETGERQPGTIGFAVQRGGDVVGEHTVSFFGAGERLELSHKAGDRALFAKGALKAAHWISRQGPGMYSMRDVLGL